MRLLTRRSVLSSIAVAPVALQAYASGHKAAATRLFLGTYTDRPDSSSKGIYTCSWNASTGTLGEIQLSIATPNPTFVVASANRLYAVNEIGGDHVGAVTTFASKAGQPALQTVNSVSSAANGPCHLALDHSERAVFVANYSGGTLSSYKVSSTGLSEPVSVIKFPGHSMDKDRQTSAHTHCVLVSPDNGFLVVNDLGLDRIMVFRIDPVTAVLTPAATPYWDATTGSGPRHSIFHPRGRWVYSANELNSTVDHLEWTGATGGLTYKTTVSSLPPDVRGQKNAPAELAIDDAGQFLYISNRFHDSIGVFAIDQQTGELTAKQDISCGGKTPRHFTLDPTGRWVLVANQDSGNIVVFERNRTTGELTATGKSYSLGAPVCIVFA